MQKNHFLLLKNFKNTESAQLCESDCISVFSSSQGLKIFFQRQFPTLRDNKTEFVHLTITSGLQLKRKFPSPHNMHGMYSVIKSTCTLTVNKKFLNFLNRNLILKHKVL